MYRTRSACSERIYISICCITGGDKKCGQISAHSTAFREWSLFMGGGGGGGGKWEGGGANEVLPL